MMNYVKIRCNQYIKHIEDCFAAIFRFTKYFLPCLYIAYVIQYHHQLMRFTVSYCEFSIKKYKTFAGVRKYESSNIQHPL